MYDLFNCFIFCAKEKQTANGNSFSFMILYADERNVVKIVVQPHKNKIIILIIV